MYSLKYSSKVKIFIMNKLRLDPYLVYQISKRSVYLRHVYKQIIIMKVLMKLKTLFV